MPCQIPDDLLKFTAHRKNLRSHATQKHHHSRNSMHHSHHLHNANQPPIPGLPGQPQSIMQQQIRSATGQDLYATDLTGAPVGGLVDPMNRMQIPAIGKSIFFTITLNAKIFFYFLML